MSHFPRIFSRCHISLACFQSRWPIIADTRVIPYILLCFTVMSPEDKDSDNTKSKQEGVIFYILIAASAAALLIFGTLLIYFIITMRKMGNNDERTQGSRLTNNQSSLTNGNHVTSKNQHQKTCKIDVENSGKRYTRGKLANIRSTNTCTTVNEHSNGTDTLSHHNNLYVSNFQFNANWNGLNSINLICIHRMLVTWSLITFTYTVFNHLPHMQTDLQ